MSWQPLVSVLTYRAWDRASCFLTHMLAVWSLSFWGSPISTSHPPVVAPGLPAAPASYTPSLYSHAKSFLTYSFLYPRCFCSSLKEVWKASLWRNTQPWVRELASLARSIFPESDLSFRTSLTKENGSSVPMSLFRKPPGTTTWGVCSQWLLTIY